MNKEIKLKIDKHWFEKVEQGKKRFEVRLGDKNIKEGDVLILLEKNEEGKLTGKKIKKNVDSVLNLKDIDYWSYGDVARNGFIVASLS